MENRKFLTLDQFIADQERKAGHTSGAFSSLLRNIALAAKVVNHEVNRAGMADILGDAGTTNVQGEDVKKLDVVANEQFIRALNLCGNVCAMASEENDDYIPTGHLNAEYVVLFDPLDGSSNIDVNVSIGTIFSIYRRVSAIGAPATLADCLQPGSAQVCAGYVIYPTVGEFFLTHPDLRFPEKPLYYSYNDADETLFPQGFQDYLRDLRVRIREKGAGLKPRYIGSLVADFHRNLLKGGIFCYPGTTKKPEGKLRLCYEGNPMAYLAEQAGGSATNGFQRIMEITPVKLHQRTPLVVGNSCEVDLVGQFQVKETASA
jgi:fructose-1,6-bisphosphatase I